MRYPRFLIPQDKDGEPQEKKSKKQCSYLARYDRDVPAKKRALKSFFETGKPLPGEDDVRGRDGGRGGRGKHGGDVDEDVDEVLEDEGDEIQHAAGGLSGESTASAVGGGRDGDEEEDDAMDVAGGAAGDPAASPDAGEGSVDRDELKRRYRHVMDTKFRPHFATISIMDQLRLVPQWRQKLRRDLQRLVEAHGLKRVGDKPGEANLLFECNEDPALVLHGTEVLGLIVRLGAERSKACAPALLRRGELGKGMGQKKLVLYAIKILLYPGAPTITIEFDSAGGIIIHRDRVAYVMRTVLCLGLEDDEALGGRPRRLPAFKARPMYVPPELSGEPDDFLDFTLEVTEGDAVVGTYAGLRDGHAWGPHWASAVGAQGSLLSSSVRIIMDFGVARDGHKSLELESGLYPSSAYKGPAPTPDQPEFVIPADWLTNPAIETTETVIHRQISEFIASQAVVWVGCPHRDNPVSVVRQRWRGAGRR
jgi:hypothetical protein